MRCSAPFIFVLLVTACAQVRDPIGGDKDVASPVLLNAEPPNGSVHFQGQKILLQFNERVKLDRVRERLMVSPPLDKPPDVQVVGGQDVVLTLKSPLAANTTYTFNIGEAVVDLTEGNVATGLNYVISTGAVLDSLSVSGNLEDAFTAEPGPGVLVILHADTDTTGFTSGRPAYFTRTDKVGRFALHNLRGGSYRLHALLDQNANYRYDLPNERVAFADTLVVAGDDTAHTLRLFLGQAPTQQVLSDVVQPDRGWRLVLAKPGDTLGLRQLDREGGSLAWIPEWSYGRDTVLFWPSDTTFLDGQHFALVDRNGTVDTLIYHVQRKMPYYVDVKSDGRAADGRWLLRTSRPVRAIVADRVQAHMDSVAHELPLAIDPDDGRRLMAAGAPMDGGVILTLMPGALTDLYGGSNDTLRIALEEGNKETVGDLDIRLVPDSSAAPSGPFVLQLLNAQGGLVLSEHFDALPWTKRATQVRAGTYTLKLIADTDGDGRWTTGSLLHHRQPERVFRQRGEVSVRAGWEVGVDWSVSDR